VLKQGHYHSHTPSTATTVVQSSAVVDISLTLLKLGGVLVGLYTLLMLSVEFWTPHIPPAWEAPLGGLADALAKEPKFATDPLLQSQVAPSFNALAQQTTGTMGYPLTLHTVKDDTLNAFALPGGHIFVYGGLLRAFPEEDTLQFVLAHEMGHVYHRHHLLNMGHMAAGLLFLGPVALALPGSATKEIANVVHLNHMRYNQEHELQADTYALELFAKLHKNPAVALTVFERLGTLAPESNVESWYATHPTSTKRLERATAWLASHPQH
jgi:predicted Zn-dependent protease